MKRGNLYKATKGQIPIRIIREPTMSEQADLQPGEAGTAPEPIFDPDRDGKPGISWPAAAILIAVIIGVVVLGLNGVLDLQDLLKTGMGALGGGALAKIRKPAGN